ncbi:MAG: UvrD-helicase domain-containing protein [Candidatus Kerfeldbacteria bacterium]|nr:UvrD-helicase domain-containing protein [Candidatus Kerfeldbacteria bacterium]
MPGVIPEKVNVEQQAAITHGHGPLLIIAGAGTGKTTVVTERIADLIMNRQVPADNILALTFTDKAADEMQDRVERILPYGYVDLWVTTFHSFGQRLLQAHALDIGLPDNFRLLNQTEQWMLIRNHLDEFELNYYRPLGNPTKFISALVKHFSRLKDEDISPEEYIKYARALTKGKAKKSLPEEDVAEADRVMEMAKAYETYTKLLLDEGALDFGDLILYTLKLLRERPAILKKYQHQFQHILVDEFQDTNWAQFELIKRLAAPRNNLAVVGDDDQSIYKFRGASVSNILEFEKDFPDAKVIVLTKNYRTKQSILDLSYQFIQLNNPDRLEAKIMDGGALHQTAQDGELKVVKRLKAQRDGQGEIELMHVQTQEEEARVVADKITEMKEKNSQAAWNDFCLLVRANDHAELFIQEFEKRGMPYTFLAARGLFTKPLVLDVLAYLRLLDNYHESAAVHRILGHQLFNVPQRDIIELTHIAKKKAWSLFEAMEHCDEVTLSMEGNKGIEQLMTLVASHTALAQQKNVGEVVLAFLNDSGYLKDITKVDDTKSRDLVRLLKQFYATVQKFLAGKPEGTVREFLAYIQHVTESGDAGALEHDVESGPETIRIMTIHSAKGLEFPYVFVCNAVDQRFPSMDRKDAIEVPDALVREILPSGDAHLQEERRLMYVAITRARDGIFFTAAEDYGGTRRKKPSQFLYELKLLEPPVKAKSKAEPLPERLFQPSPPTPMGSFIGVGAGNDRYNFTKLSTYAKCPWQYRYAFVLQVPRRGSYQLSYGTSMHNALKNFFALWNTRKTDASLKSPYVSLEELLTMYERSFVDEWYDTKKKRSDYFAKGKESLTEWYKQVSKYPPEVLAVEQPFNLKVEEFVINGSIDRVDELSKNKKTGQARVKLVDYKTGKFKDKFEKEDKYQLLIYMLAAQDPNILNAEVEELQYYFLDENKDNTLKPTQKDTDAAKEWVVDSIKKIRSGDFRPTPSKIVCSFCDFKEICEFRAI